MKPKIHEFKKSKLKFMSKSKILFVLLFTSIIGLAQTKVIAYKSHSGSKSTFAKAYKKNSYELKDANFGEIGSKKKIIILDTIVAVSKNITILKMRTTRVCYKYNTSYKDLKKTDFKQFTDTLYNHKVFNKKNKIDYIKKNGNQSYITDFSNLVKDAVFIGFNK
jgi:hypothetical protein